MPPPATTSTMASAAISGITLPRFFFGSGCHWCCPGPQPGPLRRLTADVHLLVRRLPARLSVLRLSRC